MACGGDNHSYSVGDSKEGRGMCLAVGSGDVLNFSFNLLYTLLIAEFIYSGGLGAWCGAGIEIHVYAPYMDTRLTSTLPLISISGDVVRLIRGEWSGVEGAPAVASTFAWPICLSSALDS
ncbi:hypothetical protein NC651_005949 [Populus alba x Populus x berolinensis]|nr:hypothetical protein NC651_005949 [Populus alba x Populus x berolinensis]